MIYDQAEAKAEAIANKDYDAYIGAAMLSGDYYAQSGYDAQGKYIRYPRAYMKKCMDNARLEFSRLTK